jgi:Protein of unknown function (DUF3017)
MKHSAKAAGRLARHRHKQARHGAVAAAAGSAPAAPGGPAAAEAASRPAAAPGRAATAVPDGRQPPARRRLGQLSYVLVLAGIVAGLVLMRGGGQAVKGGTLVLAGAVLAGSLTRLILPDGSAGLLGSRRRLFDAALLAVLGAGLLTAGLIVRVPG